MTWIEDILAASKAEFELRRQADERERKQKLFIKQCMALAASKAIQASFGPKIPALAILWVEDSVEAAALEMGLQEHVHQEREIKIRYTGRKRVRRWWIYPRTLSGKVGMMYRGRPALWRPLSHRGWRGRTAP